MTEITTMDLFITQQERKRLGIRIRNMAEMLLAALKIDPSGRQLIIACGSGVESNNRDAIITWLNKAVCCEARMDAVEPGQVVRALERHLEHAIGDWSS
jgi:hypothetical protein